MNLRDCFGCDSGVSLAVHFPRFASRACSLPGMVLCAVLMAGCGEDVSSGNRVAVAGQVTKGGQPIARGAITFLPQADGVGSGGVITDGKYSIPQDAGPTPGKRYKVRIETTVGRPADDAPKDKIEKSQRWERSADVPAEGSSGLNFTID